MDLNNFLHTQLNEPQRAAATKERGPILVIAGAGSGKTRVITARIAHLIMNQHVAPESIIALTFTNKAAQEMRARIAAFIGEQRVQPFLGTFHAYCLRLLKQYGARIGLDSFGILDEADQLALMKKMLESASCKKFTAQQALAQISRLKNGRGVDQPEVDYIVRDLYQRYEHEKKLSKCLDFDDLLLYAIKLFQDKSFKDDFRARVRHLLVDEYQDTNLVQHELLKHMAIEQNSCVIDSLCVVGDEDQAIYSWRGATVDNIVQFAQQVRDTTLITIEQNYRSAKPILDAANHVIQHNQTRHPKKLWSTKKGSDCVMVVPCASDHQEAELIARAIKIARQRTSQTSLAQTSLAILYRTHFQSRVLEEALLRHSITYRIIGGVQFYERKEIKDLLAYLRLIINPFDRFAFGRAINCPARGLGEKFVEQFDMRWYENPFSTYHDVAKLILPELKPQQHKNLESFLAVFSGLSAGFLAEEALKIIIDRINYFDYLRDTYDPQEAHERRENVRELVNAAHYFAGCAVDSVALFLQEVALLQERPVEKVAHEPVQLMTIHAAKGLEFDTVFVTGLEEGLFPSSKSLENQANIEEERRLLYVAITRAREKLLLSWAENRYIFGSPSYQVPSRFLKELPAKIRVESHDKHNEYTIQAVMQQFFGVAGGPGLQTFGRSARVHHAQEPVVRHVRAATKSASQPVFLQKLSRERISHEQSLKKTGFKPYQPVNHATFGVGIIQSIEQRGEQTILTIAFKQGIKKISGAFVTLT